MKRVSLLVLAVVIVAACSHGSKAAKGPSTSSPTRATSSTVHGQSTPGRATAHLEVSNSTVVAGTTVTVVLVIENATGKPIPQPPCHESNQWQAFLTNGVAASGPLPTAAVGRACDRNDHTSLPTGETRLAFKTTATYFGCAPAADSYPPTPRCLPGNRMPPLPAGPYRIETDSSPFIGVPKAAAVSVRVVRPQG